ncbi:MAG: hypothetical protein CSB46_07425 [Micrococcales bacterium]|nr:MAG: hypothetical protein CSB46_07425 [Micrococcales bacterium]
MEDFLSTNPLQRREPLDDEGVAALREAARQSALEDNARRNGEQFLTKLGNQLGYDKVTVEFTEPPQ